MRSRIGPLFLTINCHTAFSSSEKAFVFRSKKNEYHKKAVISKNGWHVPFLRDFSCRISTKLELIPLLDSDYVKSRS